MPELTTAPAVLPEAASGCETADLILPWFEVQEGDLVLYAGQMHWLEQMWPLTALPGSQVGIRLLRGGALRDHYVDSNALTAVTRYVTTEGTDMAAYSLLARFEAGTGPAPRSWESPRTENLTLRDHLKAKGWSAQVVTLSDGERAERISDYGMES